MHHNQKKALQSGNPDQVLQQHEDTNATRRKRKSSGTFVRHRLKPGAVPSVFENVPKYLSKTNGMPG